MLCGGPQPLLPFSAILVKMISLWAKSPAALTVSRANLCRGDFAPREGDWGRGFEGPLWLRIRHSKTDQSRARVQHVPLIPIPGSAFCPVATVVRAFALSPSGNAE